MSSPTWVGRDDDMRRFRHENSCPVLQTDMGLSRFWPPRADQMQSAAGHGPEQNSDRRPRLMTILTNGFQGGQPPTPRTNFRNRKTCGHGILKTEALAIDALMPIDSGAIQVQGTLLVDDDVHAVLLVYRVFFFIILVVESQRIAESAATASHQADAQKRVRRN